MSNTLSNLSKDILNIIKSYMKIKTRILLSACSKKLYNIFKLTNTEYSAILAIMQKKLKLKRCLVCKKHYQNEIDIYQINFRKTNREYNYNIFKDIIEHTQHMIKNIICISCSKLSTWKKTTSCLSCNSTSIYTFEITPTNWYIQCDNCFISVRRDADGHIEFYK